MARFRGIERFVIALATVLITLIVPGLVLSASGLSNAGVVGLAGLAAVIATATLGWRVGAGTGVTVTAGLVLTDLAATTWPAATVLMVAASVCYGLTALRGWQSGVSLIPIAMGFAIAQPPTQTMTGDRPLLVIGIATLATAAFAVLVTAVLSRGLPRHASTPLSRTTAWGFAITLGLAAMITTPIAVLSGWGHAGGWLIMTPMLVIQPSVHDAVMKSVRRAVGTVAGFIIAFSLALAFPQEWVLYTLGAVFAGFALYAMGRRWDYTVFAAAITVAVVLLEGTATSVTDTAIWRLGATLAGVGIVLALIVAITPLVTRVSAHLDPAVRE